MQHFRDLAMILCNKIVIQFLCEHDWFLQRLSHLSYIVVLDDIEKLGCQYDMRKISRYNDIHDISLFTYITPPNLYTRI